MADKNNNDSELGRYINLEIASSGPMSLSTYMGLCLTHPTLGYYKQADPLGKKGDFITAPEISQMFGEFIGLYIAGCWQAMGSPASFDLVELGPGRGTLLEDAMRVLSAVDGLIPAMRLNLLEVSQPLINAQRQKLAPYNPRWIENISQLDDKETPLIIIANEFFDALPIKQFQKQNGKWHERAVGLKNTEGLPPQRTIGLSPATIPEDSLPKSVKIAEDGSVWEVGIAALRMMGELSEKLVKRTGALLAIDYGYEQTQTGDSFQAIEKHEYADPFSNPGMADLTAHVDFQALATAATNTGAIAHPLQTQGEFLINLGINERADTLVKANSDLEADIMSAKKRLIDKEEMGTLFKTLCVSSPALVPFPFNENEARS